MQIKLRHSAMRASGLVALAALWLSGVFALAHQPLGASATAQESPSTRQISPHGDLELGCQLCHSPSAWKPARISSEFHHGDFGFALEGAHARVECMDCHRSLEFQGASRECASCHADAHQGQWGNDCGSCHNTHSFIDPAAQRNLHRATRFPLSGSHLSAECELCHVPGTLAATDPRSTATECYACHAMDFAAAKSPDHVAGAFDHDCTTCHTTIAWSGGQYMGDHGFFPLRGGHAGLDCTGCHVSGVFTGLNADCFACHGADYAATTDPAHQSSGFGTDCARCHDIMAWRGATVAHTAFPLTGGHAGHECSRCHVGNVYTGTNSACVACHQADYDGTANPAHAATGFSTDCAACHDINSWQGATFDHDSFFPIYSGPHRDPWNDCTDCHINAGSYAIFSCLTCHEHRQSAMDDKHREENGYSYDSVACYDCHPRGRS